MSTRATFTQKRETTRAAERQDLKTQINPGILRQPGYPRPPALGPAALRPRVSPGLPLSGHRSPQSSSDLYTWPALSGKSFSESGAQGTSFLGSVITPVTAVAAATAGEAR